MICRITGSFPFVVEGAGETPSVLASCAFCEALIVDVRHLLKCCNDIQCYRDALPSVGEEPLCDWALKGAAEVAFLRTKVNLLVFVLLRSSMLRPPSLVVGILRSNRVVVD